MGSKGVLLTAVLFACPPAWAGAHSCLDTGHRQHITDETFVGLVNPEGVENQFKTSVCWPLTNAAGLLHDYDSFELGLYNYLSPIYDQQGIFAALFPLSFIELKAALSELLIWPLPLDGAGYFPLASYRAPHTDEDLPQSRAQSTTGLNATFTATLRLALALSDSYALTVTNAFSADYWNIGRGGHYINLRQDVVLARSDWVVKNNALVAVDTRLADGITLRIGLNDDFTWVPASGYVANLVALWASLPVVRPQGTLRNIEPFVRLGTYTNHATRIGFQFFGGLSLTWAEPFGRP